MTPTPSYQSVLLESTHLSTPILSDIMENVRFEVADRVVQSLQYTHAATILADNLSILADGVRRLREVLEILWEGDDVLPPDYDMQVTAVIKDIELSISLLWGERSAESCSLDDLRSAHVEAQRTGDIDRLMAELKASMATPSDGIERGVLAPLDLKALDPAIRMGLLEIERIIRSGVGLTTKGSLARSMEKEDAGSGDNQGHHEEMAPLYEAKIGERRDVLEQVQSLLSLTTLHTERGRAARKILSDRQIELLSVAEDISRSFTEQTSARVCLDRLGLCEVMEIDASWCRAMQSSGVFSPTSAEEYGARLYCISHHAKIPVLVYPDDNPNDSKTLFRVLSLDPVCMEDRGMVISEGHVAGYGAQSYCVRRNNPQGQPFSYFSFGGVRELMIDDRLRGTMLSAHVAENLSALLWGPQVLGALLGIGENKKDENLCSTGIFHPADHVVNTESGFSRFWISAIAGKDPLAAPCFDTDLGVYEHLRALGLPLFIRIM